MTDTRRPVGDFDRALTLLDHEIGRMRLGEPLRIRAIGGYALLKHGVREDERALTVDIDTMTSDYSAAVQQAIADVGRQVGLDEHWLNNDNLGGNDPDEIAAMYDANWIPQSDGLANIDMAVADVPTLTRAKIMAADTAALSDREQDAPDLLRLLEHQGISSYAAFRAAYPDPFEEYPEAQALVRASLGPQGLASPGEASDRRALLERELSASVDEFDDYDSDPDGYDTYY